MTACALASLTSGGAQNASKSILVEGSRPQVLGLCGRPRILLESLGFLHFLHLLLL